MRDNQHEPHDADFERALASGLKGQSAPDSICPDAETLAAFWDQSLAADEQRFWEAHCATCLRCQAHLAALAHTSVVEEDLTEAGRAPRFWWLTDWRWLVPIASAAAVLLAVWVIDPAPLIEPQVSTVRDDSVSNAATGSVEETAERRQPVALERQDVSPAERENFAPETEQALLQDQDEVSALDQVTAAEPAESDAPRDDSRNRLSAPSAMAELAERRLAPQSIDARGATAPISAGRFEASSIIQITSGDGSRRWRVLPPGRLEHSVDGGLTWTMQLEDAGATMSAGFSPSPTVCWIVGGSGAILRTVDGGETWERITAPREVDLTGVEAVDGRSARIDAADGLSFRTEDGGLTWER